MRNDIGQGKKSSYLISLVKCGLLFFVILCASFVFRNNGMQSLNWTFPYFSGAANFSKLYDWQISPEDYEVVSKKSLQEHENYHYARSEVTVKNEVNSYGYVIIVLIARNLFFWMGDINAVVLLQVMTHALLSLLVILRLKNKISQVVFFTLFAINPVMLHFVTFPFYYYWAVIPSIIFVLLVLHQRPIGWWILPITILLFICFIIRNTTLFIIFLIFAFWLWRERKVLSVPAIMLFMGLTIHALGSFSTSPWHTFYVGIGAYDNPYVKGVDDRRGFELFKEKTGIKLSTHAINGNYSNPDIREKYIKTVRDEYFKILTISPLLILKNATYNMIQAFGFGYDVDHKWLQLISGVAGLALFFLIIATRQWFWGAGILAVSGAFAPYFPPIPAYLFAAYPFTALVVGDVLEKGWTKWKTRKTI